MITLGVDPGFTGGIAFIEEKSAEILSANFLAARIGPTVCELEGPIPIEKRSNILIIINF